ncbi:MAG TPA: NAD(P)/FAD-dependent oxidoreductase [Gemmatimonadales bacterium]|nr:NAD(P)/FAD-dependent oxidoreductase [Gemmatimonadales bacterium]
MLDGEAEPGGSWSRYCDSLTPFSPARYSGLPGLPFPGDPERYPTRDEVVAYLRSYAARFGLPFRGERWVLRGCRADGGFRVLTARGEEHAARTVAVAGGASSEPHLPWLEGWDRYRACVLHSADYRNPEPFRGARVVVVGAGNSAMQIAVELARVARVTLATREPVRFLTQCLFGRDVHFWLRLTDLDHLPVDPDHRTSVLDAGRYREAIRAGRPDRRPMFRSLTSTGVAWQDGREEPADVVLFATGFRPAYPVLADLGALGPRARVLHHRGESTSVPGLFFVGLVGQRNHASATLRGAGADARVVVERLLRHLARRPGRSRERRDVRAARCLRPLVGCC